MSKTYYHYTRKEYAELITSEKCLKSNYGLVFACDTELDMKKFTYINYKIGIINLDDYCVIQFKANMKPEESYDHSTGFYHNARAVVFVTHNLKIKPIKVIPLYKFLQEELINEQRINEGASSRPINILRGK